MAAKTGSVPFSGTKEQEEALLKVISELKNEKGALMPILQKAQDIYGSFLMKPVSLWKKFTASPRFIPSLR